MLNKPSALPLSLFTGTSGWAYPTWKPGFYPASVTAKKFLTFYSSRLNSVEVNSTFTKVPTNGMVEDWLKQTHDGFRFSIKAPQRITHFSRLLDCNQHVADLLAAIAPIAAAVRLGPILFQLPPNFKPDLVRLRDFLDLPAWQNAPMLAFEFRHPGWFVPQAEALFAERNIAFCNADYGDEPGDLQTPELHTARSHTCFRMRRTGGYKARELSALAERLAELARTRLVFVYFRHEDKPTGALNADALLKSAERISKRAAI